MKKLFMIMVMALFTTVAIGQEEEPLFLLFEFIPTKVTPLGAYFSTVARVTSSDPIT